MTIPKTIEGPIRNKEKTKKGLIDAVGKIILEDGYTKLGINRIAKVAGVDKKLIYRYYGNLDELIASYFRQRDFWSQSEVDEKLNEIPNQFEDFGESVAKNFLIQLMDYLDSNVEAQKILVWGLSEENDFIKKLSYERELISTEYFKLTDPFFEKSDIDLRASYAILLAGVYYLILHTNSTGGTFCELDLQKQEDKDRVKRSLEKLLGLCFKQVK
ncbi:TetR/AcrR family transcriptional regulator [Sphingobacterium hungaricum]|uniref:TetR/AcrR family transcriptional regulator n=1 Tax=Sphingobacterium hungaricum TaxID=2082723 RepID=A0A928YTG2_9SPHI|nr:TetR/AcrR family transcriptional regulator [Sphingobacterium hungaricum]MBE8715138.1 TetR/AcrR family transcriptional regulator [Sphingobacterium hungaricum]